MSSHQCRPGKCRTEFTSMSRRVSDRVHVNVQASVGQSSRQCPGECRTEFTSMSGRVSDRVHVNVQVSVGQSSRQCPGECRTEFMSMSRRVSDRVHVNVQVSVGQSSRQCPGECRTEFTSMSRRVSDRVHVNVQVSVGQSSRQCPGVCRTEFTSMSGRVSDRVHVNVQVSVGQSSRQCPGCLEGRDWGLSVPGSEPSLGCREGERPALYVLDRLVYVVFEVCDGGKQTQIMSVDIPLACRHHELSTHKHPALQKLITGDMSTITCPASDRWHVNNHMSSLRQVTCQQSHVQPQTGDMSTITCPASDSFQDDVLRGLALLALKLLGHECHPRPAGNLLMKLVRSNWRVCMYSPLLGSAAKTVQGMFACIPQCWVLQQRLTVQGMFACIPQCWFLQQRLTVQGMFACIPQCWVLQLRLTVQGMFACIPQCWVLQQRLTVQGMFACIPQCWFLQQRLTVQGMFACIPQCWVLQQRLTVQGMFACIPQCWVLQQRLTVQGMFACIPQCWFLQQRLTVQGMFACIPQCWVLQQRLTVQGMFACIPHCWTNRAGHVCLYSPLMGSTAKTNRAGHVCLYSPLMGSTAKTNHAGHTNRAGHVCLYSPLMGSTAKTNRAGHVYLYSPLMGSTAKTNRQGMFASKTNRAGQVCLYSPLMGSTAKTNRAGKVCLYSPLMGSTAKTNRAGQVRLYSPLMGSTAKTNRAGQVCLYSPLMGSTAKTNRAGHVCLYSPLMGSTAKTNRAGQCENVCINWSQCQLGKYSYLHKLCRLFEYMDNTMKQESGISHYIKPEAMKHEQERNGADLDEAISICPEPPEVNNANMFGNFRRVGAQVKYVCKNDVSKSGYTECMSNREWSEVNLFCLCKEPIFKTQQGSVKAGQMVTLNDTHAYITLTCVDGTHTMRMVNKPLCNTITGEWSEMKYVCCDLMAEQGWRKVLNYRVDSYQSDIMKLWHSFEESDLTGLKAGEEISDRCLYRDLSLLSNWKTNGVSGVTVRVRALQNDDQVAVLLFHGEGTDHVSWFTRSNLIESSWPNLLVSPTTEMSIAGQDGYHFLVLETDLFYCEQHAIYFGVTKRNSPCSKQLTADYRILYSPNTLQPLLTAFHSFPISKTSRQIGNMDKRGKLKST
ncbi:hypothetical protein MAR_019269 [Mya arenaria]|uniref:Sushi domain-containing protein n=1 Tax=Mya arenaria TaxID=6604 RepID=A0ABY7EQ53_MYAAR|nr:hypothetical protein MAR_019269 [Mya arenaria]